MQYAVARLLASRLELARIELGRSYRGIDSHRAEAFRMEREIPNQEAEIAEIEALLGAEAEHLIASLPKDA